ncbi:rifin PIR protein, putative [Plasmodium reichenowi]|uniref:Rifin PIR protein, putative n=1 Tax=Plasmodium reichenowi TaxID=5854 RepID=A0A2P9DKU8_PLARE|nr:rifin PIR protein, putative [Plasmodium reichenowi]
MKIHYINILLFELPLNILVHNQRNHKSTTPHITQINRSLCECDLYMPNYDNDPQMKEVMEIFDRQASQRLREYDDRMKTNRKKCKDKCDKEIQKIILKDKLEKELMDKFATLDTDIQSDAIPTCVCEKSLADKTEKFCLNCGKTMGGVAYGWGLVGGLMYTGWTHYVPIAIAKAAMDAGIEVVNQVLLKQLGIQKIPDVIFKEISSIKDFSKVTQFADIIQKELRASCTAPLSSTGAIQPGGTQICTNVMNDPPGGTIAEKYVSGALRTIVQKAPGTADAKAVEVTANYASTTSSLTTGITASILAIEIIVLIMMIIYWILRYRRKKKMKKKLQYIKLLEE